MIRYGTTTDSTVSADQNVSTTIVIDMSAPAPEKRFGAQLKALPAKPGVYIFRNAKGDVIYIGKAASLRNRVRNYFGATHSFEAEDAQVG